MGLGALTLLFIASDTGVDGLVVGLLLACTPAPFYSGLALWLDRYEPEPPSLLLGAFLWGATFAVFASYILNSIAAVFLALLFGEGGSALSGVLSAPLVEESAKGFGLLILVFGWRREVDGIVDGVIYATMVALGFAMVENVLYYGNAFHSGSQGQVTGIFILRGIFSPFSHPLFTSMTGIGVGWARQSTNTAVKMLAPFFGWIAAMTLHTLWNLSATISGGLWILAYIFIMVPVACGILVTVFFALQREGNLVRNFLQPEVDRGVLSHQELEQVASMWGRVTYSLSAFASGGPKGWWNAEGYLQAMSELAFLRYRASTGEVDGQTVSREEPALLQFLEARPLNSKAT